MRHAGGSRISKMMGADRARPTPARGPRAATALNAADMDPIISVYIRRSMPARWFSSDSGKFRGQSWPARGLDMLSAGITAAMAGRRVLRSEEQGAGPAAHRPGRACRRLRAGARESPGVVSARSRRGIFAAPLYRVRRQATLAGFTRRRRAVTSWVMRQSPRSRKPAAPPGPAMTLARRAALELHTLQDLRTVVGSVPDPHRSRQASTSWGFQTAR